MRYLRTFENFSEFDLGRFSEEEEMKNPMMGEESEEECEPCGSDEGEDEYTFSSEEDEQEQEYQTTPHRIRRWGDEDLQSATGLDEAKKAKPDFLDLDKDGDKKESMKKAAKDAKEKDSKKEDKGGKGLTAAQKKLPEGLRKAIEAKNKKK